MPAVSEAEQSQRMRAATAFEIAIAILLAALGIWRIWEADDPDAWAGFALVGLALLFYMMRGQIITKLSFSKTGIEAELAAAKKTADAALEKANEAEEKAKFAKTVVTQITGPASVATVAARKADDDDDASEAGDGDGDSWAHPELKRRPAPANDQQKHQWGGKAARNGRLLDASYDPVDEDWVNVTLRVTSTDQSKLVNKVRFHLHQTFRKSVVTKKPVDGVAELTRYAWGAFTVGAEVENEPGTYLELDLAKDEDAPPDFRKR